MKPSTSVAWVRKVWNRTTSVMAQPAAVSTARTFSKACAVWATTSPDPATSPARLVPTCPATITISPAGTVIPCEYMPSAGPSPLGGMVQLVGAVGGPRDRDGSARGVEAIGKGRAHRRMIPQGRRDRHVLVLHHQPALTHLVHVHQREKGHPTLVGDARLDVVGVHLEEESGDLGDGGWAPGIDARPQASRPGQEKQVAIVRIVIRVVMSHEDVTQAGQRHSCLGQANGHAV